MRPMRKYKIDLELISMSFCYIFQRSSELLSQSLQHGQNIVVWLSIILLAKIPDLWSNCAGVSMQRNLHQRYKESKLKGHKDRENVFPVVIGSFRVTIYSTDSREKASPFSLLMNIVILHSFLAYSFYTRRMCSFLHGKDFYLLHYNMSRYYIGWIFHSKQMFWFILVFTIRFQESTFLRLAKTHLEFFE